MILSKGRFHTLVSSLQAGSLLPTSLFKPTLERHTACSDRLLILEDSKEKGPF